MTDLRGLSDAEALARRARGEGNDVALQTTRTYLQILRENVFTFINNVLFGLGIALVLLGRADDALVSVGVVTVNLLVGLVQELRAKQVLDRIALLTRPKATVIRAGQEREVDPAEIVLGDLLLARPGDQMVVDGVVVGDGRMDVDESLLTGESDLIPKRAGDALYSGSFCVTGSAHYEVHKVGAQSFANQLTAGARVFRRVYTPLQREVNLVVRLILVLVVFFEILLVVASLVERIPVVESVRISVVIAGLVPNGLFLAMAVAYAMGAVRIAGQGALVQQANAVESLSHVDTLCLDKTGTLTTNRVKLDALHPRGMDEAALRRLLGDYAASTRTPNRTAEAIAQGCPGERRSVREEVPFSSARKWSALALGDPRQAGTFVLGAPEMLASSLGQADGLLEQADEWAEQGLRVLLFAQAPPAERLYDGDEPRLPGPLEPLGLVTFTDELRPEARETLAAFSQSGIALKIISGDNPRTVLALANQAGLPSDSRLISGLELEELDEGMFAQAAVDATIFGRVTPHQKERLVQALRDRGHYVAMIGDGVNDVLSLKRANLGIAMQSGSQATRGVADLVLLGDNFAVLPFAFREGQRILNGMQDILKLFLTRVFYAALLILSVAVAQAGFPLGPKHNSLMTLLIVGIPTIALAAWARPAPIVHKRLVQSLLHFVLPAAITLALVGLAVYVGYFLANAPQVGPVAAGASRFAAFQDAIAVARSALTTVSIFCGLLLLPFAEPPTRWWVGGETLRGDWRPTLLALVLLVLFALVLAIPGLRGFFELVPLALADYLLLAAVAIGWALVLRWVWRIRLLDRILGLDLGHRATT